MSKELSNFKYITNNSAPINEQNKQILYTNLMQLRGELYALNKVNSITSADFLNQFDHGISYINGTVLAGSNQIQIYKVNVDSLDVRVAPDSDSTIKAKLQKDERVISPIPENVVLNRYIHIHWYNISDNIGYLICNSGWVEKRGLEQVNAYSEGSGYVIPYPDELSKELAPLEEFISFVEQLEDAYKSFEGPANPSNAKERSPIKEVLYLLKYYNYNDAKWQIVLGSHQQYFYQYLCAKHTTLLDNLRKYIDGEQPELFSDGNNGVLDIAHLAATTIAYTYGVSVGMSEPWAGWAGDLLSFMGEVKKHLAVDDNKGDDPQLAADAYLGTAPYSFNYADICTDADAIKLAQMIKGADADDEHGLSNILKEYYENHTNDRMQYYLEDMGGVNASVSEIYAYLEDYMTAIPQQIATLFLNKETISKDIQKACWKAFAKYICAAIAK